MSVGMTLLVARRLALMRDHGAALRPLLEKMGEAYGANREPNKADGMPLLASQDVGVFGGRAGAAKDRVMESGILLLGLEVSAMLWLVGGWSSLVALRFRCYRRF